jgi:hypothetical protein
MIVNWNILKNPANWGIVLMMLLIAAYGGHLLLTYYGASPADSSATAQPANRNDVAGSVLG